MTEVPDRFDVDPLIGWRYWFVDIDRDSLLRSPTYATAPPWPARARARATCSRLHHAPHLACRCGLYAQRTEADLNVPTSSQWTLVVVGQVSLWGQIINCERGYRAEFGYPYALEVRPSPASLMAELIARRIAAVYGVDTAVRYVGNADR